MKFCRVSTSTSVLAWALTGLFVFSAPALTLAQEVPQTRASAQWKPTPWLDAADDAVAQQVVTFRHHIHQHPELGKQEVKTAAYVAEHLKRLGLEVHTGIAGTGVVAVLVGKLPGSTVGLRADMDALPVKETSGLPFASEAKGMYFGE